MFEETSKITHSVETLIDSTVALGTALNDILLSGSLDGAAPLNNPLLTPLLKEIAKIVAIAQEEFRTKFPLPSTAPGHTQRTKRVSEVLEHLQRVVVHLASDQGMELEAIERHLARIEPFIHSALVLVGESDCWCCVLVQLSDLVACHLGDVAELYPAAVQALVLSLSAVLLPETMVLPMFMLYSLGPHVLGEGEHGSRPMVAFSPDAA